MAFRADIVKMIEDMVTKIEEHHFKINSNMKSDFVTFINSFFKYHLDQSDINFTLNANMLYADTDDVKIIIATDNTKVFIIPGCTIPMRDPIEAFIIIDEVVGYDSLKMRCFRKAIQNSLTPSMTIPPTTPALMNSFLSPITTPTSAPTTPPAPMNSFLSPTTTPTSALSFSASPCAPMNSFLPPTTTPTSALSFSATPRAPMNSFLPPTTTPTSALSFSATTSTTTPTPSCFNFSTAQAPSTLAFQL